MLIGRRIIGLGPGEPDPRTAAVEDRPLSSATNPTTLGALVRARRAELGLTASALARAAGVVPAAVAHWERGSRRPHGQSMRRLADALDLPVEVLREAPTEPPTEA